MRRTDAIVALRSLPHELDMVLAGVTPDLARTRPSPGEWSILELCCHLRDAAEIEHERIARMATEHQPFIRAWDNDAFASERRYNEQDLREVRASLIAWWAGLAGQLESLPDAAWERAAIHEERGRITLGWRAQRQVEHPREHFEQMRAARERVANAS